MTLARIQGHEMNDKNYWNSVVVVGIAIDDQDPLNNCQDRFVETKSGTHRSGLWLLKQRLWIQISACGHRHTRTASGHRPVYTNATVTVSEILPCYQSVFPFVEWTESLPWRNYYLGRSNF